MNRLSTTTLRSLTSKYPLRAFRIFTLKSVWAAVALMAVNLSCTSAPESNDQRPNAAAIAKKQAEAAAALAAYTETNTDDLPAKNLATNAEASNPVVTNTDDILTNAMDALDDSYKLAVGDTITFQILEDDDDPKSIMVADSGDVEIPYLGRYPAVGKTCKGLATQLKATLEKKYYYRATIIISVNTMITHGVVYLVGGVKAPGPLEIPRDDVLTVSKAILRAGGFDDFADEKHVRVTRKTDEGTNEVLTVNVAAVLDRGETDKDMKTQPGDLIYVPEKTIRF